MLKTYRTNEVTKIWSSEDKYLFSRLNWFSQDWCNLESSCIKKKNEYHSSLRIAMYNYLERTGILPFVGFVRFNNLALLHFSKLVNLSSCLRSCLISMALVMLSCFWSSSSMSWFWCWMRLVRLVDPELPDPEVLLADEWGLLLNGMLVCGVDTC